MLGLCGMAVFYHVLGWEEVFEWGCTGMWPVLFVMCIIVLFW
jgi:hypothetical protein